MTPLKLYYATNRNHRGKNRWRPKSYGTKFSQDGIENLRFGNLTVDVNSEKIKAFLSEKAHTDTADGEGLAGYLSKRAKSAKIRSYPEKIDATVMDTSQDGAKLGSDSFFSDLRKTMENRCDVLVYIHGFNVSWYEAVGAALSLQLMVNRKRRSAQKKVQLVLFSWPSDGMALPYVSYKSDRTEGAGSGYAVGRGLLKLRDYLSKLGGLGNSTNQVCGQEMHLLCHSMGNYVLQNAAARIQQMHAGSSLPRLFEHIFLCAPDVDEDVFERGQPMSKLHQMSRSVSISHNRGDAAMHISDYTKGNPDRLGQAGAARPSLLHHKIQQIDCSPIVTGLVEHSYYLWGPVNTDIRHSIDGVPHDNAQRSRIQKGDLSNVWEMT